MITVCNVKIGMKCVHTLRTDRHKRQADITLLFEYKVKPRLFEVPGTAGILSNNR